MAKSKRGAKPVEIKEVEAPVIKDQVKVEEKTERVFNPDHLRKIETSLLEIENKKLITAVEEQNLQNMNLTMEILKSRIEKQKQVIQARAREYENAKGSYRKFKEDIFPMYGIQDLEMVEYDSDTGKIF